MNSLLQRRLLDCLAAVAGAPPGVVATSHAIVEQLERLIPGDSTVLGYRRASDGAYYGFWRPLEYAVDRFGEAYHAHAREHPFVRHFQRHPQAGAVRFSDLVTDRTLRNQALYQEFFEPLGTRRLLGRVIPVPNLAEWEFRLEDGGFRYATNAPLYPFTTFSMAIGRETSDFSDMERLLFDRFCEVVAPQFVRELRCELATRGQPIETTPGSLTRDDAMAPIDPRPLGVFADLATAPAVEKISGHYGLSARESEVLHWLAVGKTNPEIALIIGSGVRTIQSQVQSIFQKLSVENRLAAARIVWQMEITGGP
jgi:DNA-binding CsgD family transcriptional regulator